MKGERIVGIGIDLVETDRIRNAIRRWGETFTARIFLESERAECERRARPWVHYAGRFAVKEAVAKALGTGIGVGSRLDWLDIEVVSDRDEGAPSVRLAPAAERVLRSRGGDRVVVSLAHARDYAVAQAVLIGQA